MSAYDILQNLYFKPYTVSITKQNYIATVSDKKAFPSSENINNGTNTLE